MGTLLQMVAQNHQMAEGGHKRLREDLRDMEHELEAMKLANESLATRLARIESAPVSADKVKFTPGQIVTVALVCLGLGGGLWRLDDGIKQLETRIANASQLQDERNETQKQAMDQLRAAIEMRRVEIQNLSNFIQTNVAPRPGARP